MPVSADLRNIHVTGMAVHLAARKLAGSVIRALVMALTADSAVVPRITQDSPHARIQHFHSLGGYVAGQSRAAFRTLSRTAGVAGGPAPVGD